MKATDPHQIAIARSGPRRAGAGDLDVKFEARMLPGQDDALVAQIRQIEVAIDLIRFQRREADIGADHGIGGGDGRRDAISGLYVTKDGQFAEKTSH